MGVFVKKTGILYMNFHLYKPKTFSVMMTMVKMFELVPHSLKLFILRVIKFLVYAIFYILSYVFCSVRYSLKMERDV